MTTIGNNAFQCRDLTSVRIPKSVDFIDSFSFGYDIGNNKESNFKIYGYLNSSAESYAKDNGFKFIAIDETIYQPGDLNNDRVITTKDLLIMKELALGLYEDGSIEDFILLVDLNEDGNFSSADLVLMIHMLLEG